MTGALSFGILDRAFHREAFPSAGGARVNRPHVIVWDLDRTLGDFTALQQQGESAGPVTVQVRHGLHQALHTLTEAGFVHTVLTLATPLYAEIVLRGTGLRQHFVLVEGLGQRDKGDAAGIAADLGIAPGERPHRMLFVGDHPLFDEPRDVDVLFHLEPCGLMRPAEELARLVVHLREAGGGSLRHGFDALARQTAWWRRLWPARARPAEDALLRRSVPGIGDLVVVPRANACPVIAFALPPDAPAVPAVCSFVPAELLAQVEAELGQEG
jgi:hypothetical protein